MLKKCPGCKTVKNAEEFYKNRRSYDGLQTVCKECQKAPVTKEKERLLRDGFKKCGHCGAVKSVEEFYPDKTEKYKISSRCKQCESDYAKQHYPKVKEKHNAKNREWRKSTRGLKILSEYWKNSEVFKKNRLEGVKRYSKRYPEKVIARNAVNHAIEHGRLPRADSQICSECHIRQATQYHHHRGYDKEHRLDVIPVCHECHTLIHHPSLTQ